MVCFRRIADIQRWRLSSLILVTLFPMTAEHLVRSDNQSVSLCHAAAEPRLTRLDFRRMTISSFGALARLRVTATSMAAIRHQYFYFVQRLARRATVFTDHQLFIGHGKMQSIAPARGT